MYVSKKIGFFRDHYATIIVPMIQKNKSSKIPFICICVYVNRETFTYAYMNTQKNIEEFILGS